MEKEGVKTMNRTCCVRVDTVRWNSFNGAVQCHSCGTVYEPAGTRANTRDRWVAVETRQELIKAAEKFCWERIQDDHPPFSAIPEVAADFALHTRVAGGNEVKTGIDLIADERQRQMDVEGWTPEHDDEHDTGSLAEAAIQYADYGRFLVYTEREDGEQYFRGMPPEPSKWPWDDKWWKPDWKDPIRNLVKAGALIAAEIDRIQRRDTPQEGGENVVS